MRVSKNTPYILRASLVHLYTSLGLVLAFFNVFAILSKDAKQSLLFFLLAVLVDGTDGFLARRANVQRWTPSFDGRKLDDIVDYLNYAFLPICFAYQFGLIGRSTVWVAPLVLISAAYGFCQRAAKTEDHSFTGFPNYWNFLVMYLYWLDAAPAVNAAILSVFAILVWVPLPYVSHRTKRYQLLTVPLVVFFLAVLGDMVLQMRPDPRLLWASLILPAYYVGISLFLFLQRHLRKSEFS